LCLFQVYLHNWCRNHGIHGKPKVIKDEEGEGIAKDKAESGSAPASE
jgi:hypothetical protein